MTFQKKIVNRFFLYFLFVCFLVFAVVIPVRAAFIPYIENLIHVLTNQEREAVGLPPLLSESRLVNMARQHSEEMAAFDYFDHTSPVSGYETLRDRAERSTITDWRRLGENIGYLDGGPEERMAEIIVDAWMDSSGHRENILDDVFTHLGVGVFELNGEYYFTQNFAAFSSDTSVASSPQYSQSSYSNNYALYPRTPFSTGLPFSGSSFNTGMPLGGTSYRTGLPFSGSSFGSIWPFGGTSFGSSTPLSATYLGAGFPFSGSFLGTGSTFGSGLSMGETAFGIGFPYSSAFLGRGVPFGGASYGYGTGLPYSGISFGTSFPFGGMPFGRGSAFGYGLPFSGYNFW